MSSIAASSLRSAVTRHAPNLYDDQIRRLAIGNIEDLHSLLATFLLDKPLRGDAGVDDEPHRTRSSRISSVLSDCGTRGVRAAI